MKEIYKVKVPSRKSPRATFLILVIALVVCSLALKIASFLPASWIFQIAIIAFCAIFINRLLKQGTFSLTYILYEDSLSVLTRYGFIEMVTASYPLNECTFSENSITYNGRNFPFYPDENLKKLLNI